MQKWIVKTYYMNTLESEFHFSSKEEAMACYNNKLSASKQGLTNFSVSYPVMMIDREISIFKICSCGKVHMHIPVGAKLMQEGNAFMDGYYWNCICNSTLFSPLKELGE